MSLAAAIGQGQTICVTASGELGRGPTVGFQDGEPASVRWSFARSGTLQERRGTVQWAMTAKERLRERIEALSEEEASEALRLLDQPQDPVIAAFRDAPEDDEPWTDDDEAAAAEGRADIAAGRTVSLDEAMREFE